LGSKGRTYIRPEEVLILKKGEMQVPKTSTPKVRCLIGQACNSHRARLKASPGSTEHNQLFTLGCPPRQACRVLRKHQCLRSLLYAQGGWRLMMKSYLGSSSTPLPAPGAVISLTESNDLTFDQNIKSTLLSVAPRTHLCGTWLQHVAYVFLALPEFFPYPAPLCRRKEIPKEPTKD